MPWKESTLMSSRMEFIHLAEQGSVNLSELCRRFGISRKTGYKWLQRYRAAGESGLADRSRRPQHSPTRSSAAVEAAVVEVRQAHPAWGGRKIKAYLERQGMVSLPSPSTITQILRRSEQLEEQEAPKHRPFRRFEREQPNQLWQMDFKGYFALTGGGYCHPLSVLDDHSRFLVGLEACPNETAQTVQAHLTDIFRCYGLPDGMLMDNGPPWGHDGEVHHTLLTAWLIRLGIRIHHGRPYHPQTQGKDERLHRTLQAELLSRQAWTQLEECQQQFDRWRQLYNCDRPHEALELQPPVSRYQASLRPFPEVLPPVLYEPGEIVRKVDQGGNIYFHNRRFRVGRAFCYQPVALRPAPQEEEYEVFFCQMKVARIRLCEDNC